MKYQKQIPDYRKPSLNSGTSGIFPVGVVLVIWLLSTTWLRFQSFPLLYACTSLVPSQSGSFEYTRKKLSSSSKQGQSSHYIINQNFHQPCSRAVPRFPSFSAWEKGYNFIDHNQNTYLIVNINIISCMFNAVTIMSLYVPGHWKKCNTRRESSPGGDCWKDCLWFTRKLKEESSQRKNLGYMIVQFQYIHFIILLYCC